MVVWASQGQDGSGAGVYAQRFSVSGAPLGGEFQVNSTTAGDQNSPAVAMAPNGDFVVSWQSYGQDGSGWGVYAKHYSAAGAPVGGEFRVNTTTQGDQKGPAVAMDAAGEFVVSWQANNQGGTGWDIYAQRYSASGAALGGEFRANSTAGKAQKAPAVAMDAAGDFVVTWQSAGQDGSGAGVYAQRYSASGVALGGEFRVNTTTQGDQLDPAVAMSPLGEFTVVWSSYGQDGSGWGVYAQRYSAAGAPVGREFQVNLTTAGDQQSPSIAMDTHGNFLVGWQSNGQDGSGWGIYGRQFNRSGVALGMEFSINSTTAGDQATPSWAVDGNGDAVVVWSGSGAGDGSGVFSQQFTVSAGNGLSDLQPELFPDLGDLFADEPAADQGRAASAPAATTAALPGGLTDHRLDVPLAALAAAPQDARPALLREAVAGEFLVGLSHGRGHAAGTEAGLHIFAPVSEGPSVFLSFFTPDAPESIPVPVVTGELLARMQPDIAVGEILVGASTQGAAQEVRTAAAAWPSLCTECFADVGRLDDARSDPGGGAAGTGEISLALSPALVAGLAMLLADRWQSGGPEEDPRGRRPDLRRER